MSYVRYNIDVDESLYQSYEEIRKKFKGDHLSKKDIEELLGDIGFPMKSPRMWELLKSCDILIQKGKARYTYYLFPIDTVPYSHFERLEKEYYNGMSKVKKPKKEKSKEVARTPITEEYCVNFLKNSKNKKYIVLEIDDIDINRLKEIVNPKLLFDMCNMKIL